MIEADEVLESGMSHAQRPVSVAECAVAIGPRKGNGGTGVVLGILHYRPATFACSTSRAHWTKQRGLFTDKVAQMATTLSSVSST